MRSLLIVPPGDAAAYAQALASGADALVVEPALAAARGVEGPAHYLRLPALDDPRALDELRTAAALRPHGVALALAEGGADIQRLGSRLAVEEARHGLADGALRVVAFATETAQAVLQLASYRGASARLEALVFSFAPLETALGAASGRRAAGPLRLARDLTLFAARAAGVRALDAPFPGDLEGLREEAEAAARDGFDGKAALAPEQVAVIHAAFASRR